MNMNMNVREGSRTLKLLKAKAHIVLFNEYKQWIQLNTLMNMSLILNTSQQNTDMAVYWGTHSSTQCIQAVYTNEYTH